MRKIYFCVCAICLMCFSYQNSTAQVTTEDLAVLVTATVDTLAPSITLNWDVNAIATGYAIYRKSKNDKVWVFVDTLKSTTQTYTDHNVVTDSAYEYWVHRDNDSADVQSEGYIYASVKLHATEYRGKVILLVDSTYRDSFTTELTRLKFDLIGDGWVVIPHFVSPNDKVTTTRNTIIADYNADPTDVTALFIFGHVPVPYSGEINPDGHPNHLGAWPADGIYGDMTGIYTDLTEYDTTGIILANQNVAGDGKFDQSLFSQPIRLEVGRVDLSDMDTFKSSEPTLLRKYLNKDHAFRQKYFTARPHAVISDNFGPFYDGGLSHYEGFASCGWRDFAPLVGTDSTAGGGYLSSMATETYIWSYGCGGGYPQGAGGIGTTTDFAHDSVRTVFTALFGSYFGDWGFPSDFLRAPLASQPNALSCAWSGRPYWHFHFMGSGETLGYCARWAQNNNTTYDYNYAANYVHIALMGDPTLTMRIVAPAANPKLQVLNANTQVAFQWSPSPDTIRGYYVYRSQVLNGKYTRIASLASNDTSFIDTLPLVGSDYYMVRALALENTPSGYYFNLSEGVIDSALGIVSGIEPLAINNNQLSVYPNPSSGAVTISYSKDIEEIRVTNALGQVIYTDKPLQPRFTFELKSEGIYFTTITSGSATITKMVTISR